MTSVTLKSYLIGPHSLFGKYQEDKTAANEAMLRSWVQKHFDEFA